MLERTKNTAADDGKIRWRKEGGGSLRIGKRIIKPGEVFSAKPEQIPEAFRDIVKPLEDLPKEKEIKAATFEYKPVHKGGGKYVVERSDGKVMNDGYLTREEARAQVAELS